MIAYINEIQRQLITVYGFPENPAKPGLPMNVKDGTYPMTINGEVGGGSASVVIALWGASRPPFRPPHPRRPIDGFANRFLALPGCGPGAGESESARDSGRLQARSGASLLPSGRGRPPKGRDRDDVGGGPPSNRLRSRSSAGAPWVVGPDPTRLEDPLSWPVILRQ
jgi:hypothetical protein